MNLGQGKNVHGEWLLVEVSGEMISILVCCACECDVEEI